MRTTVKLDDKLLPEAERVSAIKERAVLVNEGLRTLIERDSARRLARSGGSQPLLTGASAVIEARMILVDTYAALSIHW